MASVGPPKRRYAPEDPTLPKPWRGLVDDATGYLYFWNPITKVTQYERPLADIIEPPSSSPLRPSSVQTYGDAANATSPSVHAQREQPLRSLEEPHQENPECASQQLSGTRTGGGDCRQRSILVEKDHGATNAGTHQSAIAYCRKHEISVVGNNVPLPFTNFESAGFPVEILREIRQAGFSAPTPIQAQSWPIALQNRDIVAVAKTGSGKTLGYLIPGFIHLKKFGKNPQMGPTVLVLSPTRELATQIQEQAVQFGSSSRFSSVCLYGGAPKGPQLRDVQKGVHIIVATPGRLNDFLQMKKVNLDQVSYLVLDEADRMLDMGFEPQIRKIVKEITRRHQTLMFTATWPKEVRKIAADLLTQVNSVQVNIGNIDELVANKAITQHVEVLSPMEKRRRLNQILRSQEPGSKIIIFCSTKRMCDQLSGILNRDFGANAIHGDKSQSDRDMVLSEFRTGKSPILVATDVAARGLDIKDIRVVVNYDFPTGIEDYVHRIGRTGRAGATGVAYTFFCDQDFKYASDLVKILEGADQKVPSELRNAASRGGGYGGERSRRWSSDYSFQDNDSRGSHGFDREPSFHKTNCEIIGSGISVRSPCDSPLLLGHAAGDAECGVGVDSESQAHHNERDYSTTSFHWSKYDGQ